MAYYVYTESYCGMTLNHGEFESYDDAQERAKKRREWAEAQDAPVSILRPHSRWEIEEPIGCGMVPDFCGVLHVSTAPPRL